VNLVFAAFHQSSGIDVFLAGLFDELSIERIEIDVIKFNGPAFADQDARTWCLTLLRRQMAHAVVFDTQANVAEPSELLRKRPLLVMRGSFSRPDLFDSRLLQAAKQQLLAEGTPFEREPATVLEMTIHHVSGVETPAVPEELACIEQLTPRGIVIVTDYPETYLLSRYLRRHSTGPARFIMGVAAAAKTLQERFYRDLPGTLLEGVGKLLATNVKLYVAPMPLPAFNAAVGDLSGALTLRDSAKDVVALDDLMPSPPVLHLVEYLRASGRIVALEWPR
jgi:hypothetical protein